jgi:hypothetical protein
MTSNFTASILIDQTPQREENRTSALLQHNFFVNYIFVFVYHLQKVNAF